MPQLTILRENFGHRLLHKRHKYSPIRPSLVYLSFYQSEDSMITQTVHAICVNVYEYILDIKSQNSRPNKTSTHKLGRDVNKHGSKLYL